MKHFNRFFYVSSVAGSAMLGFHYGKKYNQTMPYIQPSQPVIHPELIYKRTKQQTAMVAFTVKEQKKLSKQIKNIRENKEVVSIKNLISQLFDDKFGQTQKDANTVHPFLTRMMEQDKQFARWIKQQDTLVSNAGAEWWDRLYARGWLDENIDGSRPISDYFVHVMYDVVPNDEDIDENFSLYTRNNQIFYAVLAPSGVVEHHEIHFSTNPRDRTYRDAQLIKLLGYLQKERFELTTEGIPDNFENNHKKHGTSYALIRPIFGGYKETQRWMTPEQRDIVLEDAWKRGYPLRPARYDESQAILNAELCEKIVKKVSEYIREIEVPTDDRVLYEYAGVQLFA